MNPTEKTPVVSKKVLIPFILVTSLFALWGFANAVTDPMVKAFKTVLELTNTQASWVQMAFYGGYFCMALPAAMFMRKYSYKTGVLIGLALYAIGALLFYPAASTEVFWYFCASLYILTFGLAFLETAANPYILAMGAKETATQRLNLAQAINPVGLIAGLLVAKYYVYDKLLSDDIKDFGGLDAAKKAAIRLADLSVIRDPYVVLGLLITVVFIVFLISKMPQAKEESEMPSIGTTFLALSKNSTYVLGVLAQIFYVGAQIMTWTYIYHYAEGMDIANEGVAGYEKIDVFTYQFLAFILFTVGRAVGTVLLRYLSSGKLLMYFALFAFACVAGTIWIPGLLGLYSLIGISFFMSLMFPTIYGIALGGLTEEQSKVGSAGLVMAIVGGALMPMLQGMIIDQGGEGYNDVLIAGVSEVNFSFILPLLCFVYIAWYGFSIHGKHKNRQAL